MALAADIYYWPYELKAKSALNSQSSSLVRHGALLRIGNGFADCHPWPELGDLSLDHQLKILSQGGTTPLLERSRACALADGQARLENKSLFDGLQIPKSHFLVTDLNAFDSDLVEAQGFEQVKIKLGAQDLEKQLKNLELIAEKSRLKMRLDFNASLTAELFDYFLSKASLALLDAIDYVEDPLSWDSKVWAFFSKRCRLALDRKGFSVLPTSQMTIDSFELWIVKPAVENPRPLVERAVQDIQRLVFTSYMDHPVGQSFAALEAAQTMKEHPLAVENSGLLTHLVFEKNAFSERLGVRNATLIASEGAGLGFGPLLEDLTWKKCC